MTLIVLLAIVVCVLSVVSTWRSQRRQEEGTRIMTQKLEGMERRTTSYSDEWGKWAWNKKKNNSSTRQSYCGSTG